MSKRKSIETPHIQKIRRKKKLQKRNKNILFSFLFLVLFVGLLVLLNQDFARIKSVEIKDSGSIDANLLKQETEKILEERMLLGILPGDSKFLLPKNKIEDRLSVEFTKIQEIEFKKRGGKLVISVLEYDPLFVWCNSLEEDMEECFYTSEEGYIYEEAPTIIGSVFIILDSSKTTEKIEKGIGDFVLGEEDFEIIKKHIIVFDTLGLKSRRISFGDEKQAELVFSYYDNFSNMYFAYDGGWEDRLEALSSALGTEPLSSSKKEYFANLEYLDIRFDDKVYYKFR
ncbi:hypothetical protein KC842_01750 [Candidatus Nomurabacteria bacterium]|nr:hypothetical protein [Candidatus Nomurabacteria bacterium]USN95047.1 MAG: hypothetical protein H6791_01290 [Candidatus Nomurabacteria bacterium]